MEGDRAGAKDFYGFNDPFAGFGRFGTRGDLTPSFSGRSVPFGQPTKPFGGMLGPSTFDQRVFGSRGRPFGDPVDGGFFGENRVSRLENSGGPIIQEITSDDEAEKEEEDDTQMKESATKRVRSDSLPSVQEPDGEIEDENTRRLQQKPGFLRAGSSLPQNSAFSFHSSTVTYGGLNGAYYTSSKTRRSGADGVVVEESREADATTGKATHRISRGIGNRGHSVMRRLNSDGRVDTMQTLHNLNEGELAGFEQSWRGSAGQHLPYEWMFVADDSSGRRCPNAAGGNRGGGWSLPLV
ncbi:unnamed protein product [Spirodela intermedia]|uniref:Uncharacterized protein n=1 Tax=Spirodela intermedia TaxID=51605 RepID=A0A7I8L227_SPIIN|nr:unnamed protein product [Spirodela intermedia]